MGDRDPIVDLQPFAEIAQGGTTVVYKAYQRSLDRVVLLKRLRAELRFDDELNARFEEEARLIARIHHPNVVAIHAYGRDDDGPYIVAEFVEGTDLAALLEVRALPPELAAYVVREAARGLDAAHARGVLHRDLKPANILVSNEGVVKLTDFGMASIDEPVTAEGASELRGTLAYLPPELVRGSAAERASDLFSLGATFFELLTGRRAFAGDAAGDVIDAILNRDPVVELGRRGIAPELVELCSALLAKRPEDRPARAADVAAALEGVLVRAPVPVDGALLCRWAEDPGAYTPLSIRPPEPAASAQAATSAPTAGTVLPLVPLAPEQAPVAERPAAEGDAKGREPARRTRRVVLVVLALIIVSAAMLLSISGALDGGDAARPAGTVQSAAQGTTGLQPDGDAGDVPPVVAPPADESVGVGNEETADDGALPRAEDGSPPAGGDDPAPITQSGAASEGAPEVERPVQEVQARTEAAAEAPVGEGTLFVDAMPWAEVFVDGRSVGVTPLRPAITLPAGRHRVVLKRESDLAIYESEVEIEPGRESRVEVPLWDRLGRITVYAHPYAVVRLDGAVRDTVPPVTTLIVPPGEHHLSLHHDTFGRYDTTFVIEAGTERTFRVNLQP